MAIETLILKLLSYKHETEWIEFKENWCEPETLGEFISALSKVKPIFIKF